MEAPWKYFALVVLLALVQQTMCVSLNLCSELNTADSSAIYSQYQTNGLCADACGSQYAFAITQGTNCWCSDYAPGETVSTSSCDQKCPGYPYEYCGGSSGQYAYVALNKQPSGTIGGAEPTSTQATSQAPVTTPPASTITLTPTSTPSTTQSSSADPETETVTRSPVTSIVTLPGQTQVSTVVITPTAVVSADSSPFGQGASVSTSSNGLSKGAVAGLAIGVALAVSIIAGLIIFCLWRRMKQRRAEEESMGPEMAVGGLSDTPSSMSRHTSTMSQHGLLNKNPRINTRNLSNNWSSQGLSAGSNTSPTATSNRRSLGADQRLDPHHAIYTNEDLRHSDVSLQDNTDYSRKILSVRNRTEGEVEDE